jgi:riboflavin synthase
MFAGIITAMGTVIAIDGKQEKRMTLACAYPQSAVRAGDSLACDGVCLTAVADASAHVKGCQFTVIASPETLQCTTLRHWQVGTIINLEQALKMSDALGGHLVAGHVDGYITLKASVAMQDCHCLTLTLPLSLAPFIASKGSVCLNGVSLTVNEVGAEHFTVMIIPHTWMHTNFHLLAVGQEVHVEIDLIARYVGRYLAATRGTG